MTIFDYANPPIHREVGDQVKRLSVWRADMEWDDDVEVVRASDYDALETERAKEWRARRDAEADRDTARAALAEVRAERDRLREALIYARKEAVYGLNHAKTHLQACAALGRISGGTDHALQGAQP